MTATVEERKATNKALIDDCLLYTSCSQFGVEVIGQTAELVEEFYAVSAERHITHPCVLAITDAARGQLFSV